MNTQESHFYLDIHCFFFFLILIFILGLSVFSFLFFSFFYSWSSTNPASFKMGRSSCFLYISIKISQPPRNSPFTYNWGIVGQSLKKKKKKKKKMSIPFQKKEKEERTRKQFQKTQNISPTNTTPFLSTKLFVFFFFFFYLLTFPSSKSLIPSSDFRKKLFQHNQNQTLNKIITHPFYK